MESTNFFNPEVVLNSIYNGIIALDSEGVIIFFNKTAERIFNIPAHEVLYHYILDGLPHTGKKLLECLNAGKPFYGEKLKEEAITLIANINPVVHDGRILGVVSVFQDISEVEMISRELDFFRNMKNWLDAIIDSSFDGLVISDHEGKIIRVNKSAEKLSGIKLEESVGRNVKELIAESRLHRSVALEVLTERTSVTMLRDTKEGKKLLLTGNPVFGEEGELTFVVINIRDVTELDNLRNKLQETEALARGYSSKLSEIEMKGVDLSNIIFKSDEMQRIVEMALRVAKVDSTIFLLGESGVGKGLITKLIHKHSERANGPFIQIDCAGIPDSLIETELFGYEKGAFTGARVEGKPGFLELANKGTIFLDEIGELPISSQSKLLRFLEDHEIVRVGGTVPKEVDARVIAATNRNIEKMVASKEFREDLYYRLNVVPIYIPPLRDRREDILPLIFHFAKIFNNSHQKNIILSPESIDTLHKYDFPGNIRELANIIERLIVLTEKERIEVQDLPDRVKSYEHKIITSAHLFEGLALKDATKRFETFIIKKAVGKFGSQRKAAEILKVDQATISRKIKKI